jgi:DNA-directed RNA polymerase specialized sigma24 family protein
MSRLSRAREKLQQEIDGTAGNTSGNVLKLRSVK